jgi:hypothetical protein
MVTNESEIMMNKFSLTSIPVTENDVAVSKKIIRADAKNPQWSCEFSI